MMRKLGMDSFDSRWLIALYIGKESGDRRLRETLSEADFGKVKGLTRHQVVSSFPGPNMHDGLTSIRYLPSFLQGCA